MRNPHNGALRGGSVFSAACAALLFASAGWATSVPCGSLAPLDSLTGGCYEVDQTFDNLSVSGSTAVIPGPGPVQSTSTVDLQGSDNFSAVTTPWLVSATFSPPTAADWQATGLGHVDGRINFTVNAQGDNLDPPTPGDSIQIFAATLQVLSALTGTYRLDQIIVTETLCAGTGPCSAPDTATLIAAYIGNQLSTPFYTCTTGAAFPGACAGSLSASPIQLNISGGLSTFNVTDNYFMAVFDGTDTLGSFVNQFDDAETPEPSTFVLIGTALAGARVLRSRRQQASI